MAEFSHKPPRSVAAFGWLGLFLLIQSAIAAVLRYNGICPSYWWAIGIFLAAVVCFGVSIRVFARYEAKRRAYLRNYYGRGI